MATVPTITDNFEDGTIDTAKWTATSSVGTVVSEGNGTLTFVTSTSSGYADLTSVNTFDLTGKSSTTQIITAGNQGLVSLEVYAVQLSATGNNSLFFLVSGGVLYAYKKVANVQTNVASITWDAATQRWLRIRETGGTTYWEYSRTGLDWITLWSEANPITVTAMFVVPQVGTWQAELSATVVNLDNIGMPPTARWNNRGPKPAQFKPGNAR